MSLGVPQPIESDRIVGLDLSLTATGICDERGARFHKTDLRGMERLNDILDAVIWAVVSSDLVVIEGYSYGSANQAHQLGELGGIIRHYLHTSRMAYVDVPPSTLKKFATGKGNAGKPDMLAAAIRAGYEGPNDDNCVDAWWLRILGLYKYGRCWGDTHTVYRDDAVSKIEWPT